MRRSTNRAVCTRVVQCKGFITVKIDRVAPIYESRQLVDFYRRWDKPTRLMPHVRRDPLLYEQMQTLGGAGPSSKEWSRKSMAAAIPQNAALGMPCLWRQMSSQMATICFRSCCFIGRNRTRSGLKRQMSSTVNDRWRGEFVVSGLGRWVFTVEGWVDAFKTWRRDLEKRILAGQDASVDYLIGADLLDAGANRAMGDDTGRLSGAAKALRDASRTGTSDNCA